MEQKKNDPSLENVSVLIFTLVWQNSEDDTGSKNSVMRENIKPGVLASLTIILENSVIRTSNFCDRKIIYQLFSCTVSFN